MYYFCLHYPRSPPADNYIFPLRRFFPPGKKRSSEQEGPTEEQQIAEAEATASQLPDVPKTDPSDNEHAQKKQKQGGDD